MVLSRPCLNVIEKGLNVEKLIKVKIQMRCFERCLNVLLQLSIQQQTTRQGGRKENTKILHHLHITEYI